ncbi:MAG: protein translocase subunit SecF [Candidatus Roizmanbacteria bacterium]|nr:protein translocase subunit SecF [Candidatus Roizmanbacteria bacterium]
MIRFHKYIWLYITISLIVIGSGMFSLFRFGYRYSIDFTGGSTMSYKLKKPVETKAVEKILTSMKLKVVHLSTQGTILNIQTNALTDDQEKKIQDGVKKINSNEVQTLRYETVGPTLGKETGQKTVIAALLAICGILIYMSFSFKGFNFALAAVLAMAHDFFVLLGTYSLLSYFFGAEFDLMFVTALLTTMSFSVHDTIVIFDKIREYLKSSKSNVSIEELSDKAVSETMVRSINNSLTIFFMLSALLLMGGGTIRFFIAALWIGTVTGAYSSPFVATPLLILLEKRKK